MSTTIDQRVVEMQFDNKQFERNVSTTMSSLDKLKQRLNLTGAAKGLESVGTAAKGINLSGLTSAAETVGLKFNAMWTIADQALRNITNSAYYAGKRIVSALTVDPIKTGFQEYETQINAVQTILANTESKGTTIGDVNAALDELNTYADKTIYNFTEMTRNIGTFTAAGVDLDKSVTSIKGIANLAAVSGSTSQQASTAMYQLSQALAAGKVSLMDWNSVVNAGMGGQVFQDALKRTAENMGTNVDALIKKYGSFRESLTQGEWLTADVLTETLSQLSGAYTEADLLAKGYTKEQAADILSLAQTAEDAATKVKTFTQLWDTLKESAQSGWTQTWELLVGDFEEAKEVLTQVSDVLGKMIGDSAQSRNDLLSGALDTNWEKMTKSVTDAGIEYEVFEEKVKSAMKDSGLNVDKLIKKHGSLEDVFRSGAASSDILTEALESLSGAMVDLSSIERDLKKGLSGDDVKLAQEALKNLGHDLGKTGVDGIFGANTEAAVKAFQELKGLEVTGIVDEKTLEALQEANKATTNLAESCKKFVDNIKELGGREKIIEGIKNAFTGIMNILKPIGQAFRDVFPKTTVEQVTSFIDGFRSLTESVAEFTASHSDQIYSTFKGIFDVLGVGWSVVKSLVGGIATLLGHITGLSGGFLDVTATIGGWLSNLSSGINDANIFATAIEKVTGFLGGIVDTLKEAGGAIKSAFASDSFEGAQTILDGILNAMTRIASGIGEMFAPLVDAIKNTFKGTTFTDILNDGIFAALLVGIYKFVGKLGGPLDALKEMIEGIGGEEGLFSGIKETLGSVKDALKAYQNQLNAEALKKIATSIAILAASIFVLSSIDGDALDRSVGAVTILFAELMGSLAIFSKISPNTKGLAQGVVAMNGMASALLILAAAMKIMSTMSWDEIGRGLTGTVVGLGALVAAVNLLPKQNVKKAAKAVRTLATALLILAAGMKVMGSMSMDEMTVALTGVIAGLTALVSAVNMLPKDTALRSLGMVGLATSLVILGGALKIMGSMSWGELGRGLAAMAGSLTAIVVAMNLMPKDMALRSLGMVGLATAIAILGASLKSMGSMTWDELGVGLTAFCGALLSLAIAMQIMNGTLAGSAALIIAAGALAILAPVIKSLGEMTWGGIARGLVAMAGAFAVMGIAGLLLTPLVPTLLGLSGAMALFGIGALAIGAGVLAISAGLSALAATLAVGAPAIVAAAGAIILGILELIPTLSVALGNAIIALCDVIIATVPKIADTVLIVITEVLASLAEYTPQIATSLLQFLIGCIDALAENMPQLIASAMNLVGAFFQGIIDALGGIDTTSLLKGIAGVGLLTGLMYALSALAPLVPGAMAGILGMGVLIAELALVLAAVGALAQIPGLSWLIEEGGDFLQTIGTAIGQFIGGIVGGIAEGATSTLPQVGTNLSNFMTNLKPFIEGLQVIDESTLNNAKTLASVILALTAADLLSGIAAFFKGGQSIADFGADLVAFGSAMKEYSAEVAGINTEAVSTSVSATKDLVKMAGEIPRDGLFDNDGIDNFGKDAVKFAKSMKKYGEEVVDINPTAISASVMAAKGLVEVANLIPDDGTFGTDGIDDFGKNIVKFAKSLKSYSDKIAEVSVGSITNSVASVRKLMGVITSMAGLDTSGVKSFKDAVNSLSKVSLDDFVKTFTVSTTALTNAGKNMFTSIIAGMTSMRTHFVTAIRTMINQGLDTIDQNGILFKVVGIETISKFINGVLSGKIRVSQAFTSALSSTLTAIRDYYHSFYSAGAYLVSGFANGISANRYKAAAQAKAMASAAASAARKELDEHSPSKVGYEIGDFFGIAFVNAIADNVKSAYNTSAKLANAAESGLKVAVEKIGQIISGEVDVAPTIKPVLDLTDVKSGADSISGMFSLQPSLGVLANVGAVSSMMNQRGQNGGSDDIVSAINKLGKLLMNVGNTTNIIQGITYDDGSALNTAIQTIAREALIEGRV